MKFSRKLLAIIISALALAVFSACAPAAPEPEPISPVGLWEFMTWMGTGDLPARYNDATGIVEPDIDQRGLELLEDGSGRWIAFEEDDEDEFFNWFINEEGLLVLEEMFWDVFYGFNVEENEHHGLTLQLIDEPGWFSLVRNFRIAN